jgi:hypothetical protein
LPYFRIFYNTGFTILTLALSIFLVITPADIIHQAYLSGDLWSIVIVAGACFLTLVVALFIYATRLYINRSYLAAIPKSWIPIKKGDVTASVWEMISKGVQRSASIAFAARPRTLPKPAPDTAAPDQATDTPAWGAVSHPGWSSPSCPDLPHLHYEPVFLELPHLIEAKAVSLAPVDPLYQAPPDNPSATPLPDALAVSLLQRPATLGLRAYLMHLTGMGMLPAGSPAQFLTLYERARFGRDPLAEPAFRTLMSAFASLLRSMTPPPADLISALHASRSASTLHTPSTVSHLPFHTPRLARPLSSSSSSSATDSTVSHRPFHTPLPRHGFLSESFRAPSDASLAGSEGSRSAHTAHTRPRLRTRTSSRGTGGRWPSAGGTESGELLRRVEAGESAVGPDSGDGGDSSGGSVIHVEGAGGVGGLPFEFVEVGVGGEEAEAEAEEEEKEEDEEDEDEEEEDEEEAEAEEDVE